MENISRNIDDILFWHQVPLNDGRITPGKVPIYLYKENYLFDKLNLSGSTVLDIGCWDGYFSFEAEKAGAKYVLGLDDPDYRWGGLDGFNFLKDHFNSSVDWMRGSIYNPPKQLFDIVMCYGILYHLSDPLLAAINSFRLSNKQVVFEGLFFEHQDSVMMMAAPGEISNDYSNVFLISTGWMNSLAHYCGFELASKYMVGNTRGTLLYNRVSEEESSFLDRCFPIKPISRQELRGMN